MGRKPTYEELAHRVKTLEAENLAEKEAQQALRLEAERFRESAELLPEIVFKMEAGNTITFVNRESYEITGYSQEDLTRGFEATDLLIPADRERAKRNIRRLFQGEEIGMSEYTAQRKDGTTFPVLVRSSLVFLDGKVVGLRGFLIDTTERKRKEEELNRHQDELEGLVAERTAELERANRELRREITVRKRIEEELRESEARYRTLVEHMPAVTYTARLDQASTTEYVSPQIEGLLGFSQKDYREDPDIWRKALHPDDRVRVLEEVARTHECGEPLISEYRMIDRHGDIVWLRDHAAIVRSDRGEPLFLHGVMLDMTAHKQIEEALRESEERFRTIFEGSLDAIMLADPQTGEILDVNPTLSDLILMPQEEIVGLPYMRFVAPGSEEYVEEIFAKVARDEMMMQPYEIPARRSDGRRILFEGLGQIIQIDGKPVALVVLRDITERKRVENALCESEARYRRLFDESPVALWEVDASSVKAYLDELRNRGIKDLKSYFEDHPQEALYGLMGVRVTDTNKANVELFEAGSKEAFQQGAPKIIIEDEDTIRKCAAELINLVEGRTESEVTDVTVRTFKGERKHVVYRWSVVPGYHRTFAKVLVSVMDITDRKQMEQELQKIQKLESLGILAGGIAHDFNNILTAISTNLSMARMYGDLHDDISQMLTDAENASLRAKNLTQQLLAFAKGGTPIKKTVSIPRLIKMTTEFTLSGSNVGCDYSLPDDLWLVEVDEGQIGQVIQNLIINADQAMPRGGTIKICAEGIVVGEQDALPLKRGKYVRVSITDQGTGISKKDMENIFDPFFTTKQRGSGLGLTTAFSIVNNHGGHIGVDSQVEVGTTFAVYLPASGRTSEEKERSNRRLLKGEGRILLVDDEEIIRRAAGEALTRMGYEVRFAEEGAQGIGLYKEAMNAGQPFDAVIMDLTIPGGTGGKEAIKELLQIDPDAKVVASSGYSNDPVMSDFHKYGFCGVITKPYRIEELGELLSRVTEGVRG